MLHKRSPSASARTFKVQSASEPLLEHIDRRRVEGLGRSNRSTSSSNRNYTLTHTGLTTTTTTDLYQRHFSDFNSGTYLPLHFKHTHVCSFIDSTKVYSPSLVSNQFSRDEGALPLLLFAAAAAAAAHLREKRSKYIYNYY